MPATRGVAGEPKTYPMPLLGSGVPSLELARNLRLPPGSAGS